MVGENREWSKINENGDAYNIVDLTEMNLDFEWLDEFSVSKRVRTTA